MPITRAQYLSGDDSYAPVLSGQVQGVTQGFGVIIANDGTISIDLATITPTRFLPLTVTPAFDGVRQTFTLLDPSLTPWTVTPLNNIMVFVGGVIQIPMVSYVISGTDIAFTGIPPLGASFYAVTTTFP